MAATIQYSTTLKCQQPMVFYFLTCLHGTLKALNYLLIYNNSMHQTHLFELSYSSLCLLSIPSILNTVIENLLNKLACLFVYKI